jgi:CubicO group peptidase (beta-lactamase class C family)
MRMLVLMAMPAIRRPAGRSPRSPRRAPRWVAVGLGLLLAAHAFAADPAAAAPGAAAAAAQALAAEIAEGRHPGVTSFHFEVGGRTLAAQVEPALAPPDLRSATKSITALLVGVALERGHIPSLHTRVAELLPEHRAALEQDPRKAAITVEDLLTMRSGLDCDDWNPGSPGHEDTMYTAADWVAFWAGLPAREAPGSRFAYCTGNVIALGAILEAGSGQPLASFAETALFAPLGIRGARWARFHRGRGTDAGGHLRLRPEDFARLGSLVLAEGRWDGRSLVPAAWIRRMTTPQTSVPGRKQRYGYLWWIDETSPGYAVQTRLFLAWGNGGNFLVVMPELQAVASFTGTRFNRPEALQPLHWLRERLLPALAPAPR